MATKKQVRARVAAKREAFEAEYRRTGLEAQRVDVERREARAAQKKRDEEAAALKKSQQTKAAVAEMAREIADESSTEQECV